MTQKADPISRGLRRGSVVLVLVFMASESRPDFEGIKTFL